MDVIKLATGIEIRPMSTDIFERLSAEHAKRLFDESQYFFRPRDYYSADEASRIAALRQNMGQPFRLNLGAFQDENLVGWSWGIQESAEVFYMVNSAVLPRFQRKGIYSALVRAVLQEARHQGFQVIYSKHVVTNNAVIVPKLKAGFTISSIDVSDQYGVLVHLRWYANPIRQKMVAFRTGGIAADAEIKAMLDRG